MSSIEQDGQFITSFRANESYKNIKVGFEWNDIPRFAVITGENGSGKTALLEQIKSLGRFGKIQYISNIFLINKAYKNNYISIPFENGKNIIFMDKKNISINNTQNKLEQDIIVFFNQFKKYFERNNITKEVFLSEDIDKIEQLLASKNDINFDSVPAIFNEELLINTFGLYFRRFEDYKREIEYQYSQKSVSEIEKEAEKEIGGNPLDKINAILQQYYSKYKIEVSRDISDNIHLICRDRQNRNKIPLNQLSLGEQIIISLVLWQYENTSLDSIILLLDEPDAHLNPKMAKMLINILKNIVVEKFNCQVIMTTHSLSSVAYCEEKDLFFMEEGKIRPIEKKEAIEKLSEGVMTFNYAINVIEQIQQFNKILMVEGETDKLHIENFYQLKGEKLPFKIIACNGASNMRHVAIAFEQLKIPHEKILFLCDYDKEGIAAYKDLKKNLKYVAIYTLDIESLSKDDDIIRLKNYPIEMLCPLDILKNNNLLEELGLKDYLIDLDNTSQIEKSKEFEQLQAKEKYKIKSDSDKSKFANEVIKTLDINKDFEEVEGLIIRIKKSLKISS